MTITLYSIKDDRRKLRKTLDLTTKLGDLTAHLKDDTDYINPVLEIAYNPAYESANYVYISDFGRYYFIENKNAGAQRMYLYCTVDVLTTYADDIDDITILVERYENSEIKTDNKCDLYVPDKAFKAETRHVLEVLPAVDSSGHAVGFTKKLNCVLTTGGRS